MSSMRKCMFQMVLDRNVNHVVEYGRAPYEELQQFKVSHIKLFHNEYYGAVFLFFPEGNRGM